MNIIKKSYLIDKGAQYFLNLNILHCCSLQHLLFISSSFFLLLLLLLLYAYTTTSLRLPLTEMAVGWENRLVVAAAAAGRRIFWLRSRVTFSSRTTRTRTYRYSSPALTNVSQPTDVRCYQQSVSQCPLSFTPLPLSLFRSSLEWNEKERERFCLTERSDRQSSWAAASAKNLEWGACK